MTDNTSTAVAYGTPQIAAREGKLGYLPVALFGSVMGLAGLSSAWRLAGQLYALPQWIAPLFGFFALLAFGLALASYRGGSDELSPVLVGHLRHSDHASIARHPHHLWHSTGTAIQ